MSVKLLTEHHLEFLGLKEGSKDSSELHLSKCHIVGNHVSQLNFIFGPKLIIIIPVSLTKECPNNIFRQLYL